MKGRNGATAVVEMMWGVGVVEFNDIIINTVLGLLMVTVFLLAAKSHIILFTSSKNVN